MTSSYATYGSIIDPQVHHSHARTRGYSEFGTRADLNLIVLDPIAPHPVRDFRQFDLTSRITPADPAVAISHIDLTVGVAPNSRVRDPNPAERIFGQPTIDATGWIVQFLFGDAVDGCVYILSLTVHLSDGRILVMQGQLASVGDPTAPIILANGAVPFNYGLWLLRFPELKEVSQGQAEGFWENACLIFRNDHTSPERDPAVRQILLNLLTAHIAALMGGPNGGGGFGPQITGTINSKSVGSVSLSGGAFPGVNGTQAWYLTTKYGSEFWKKTASYRLFRYVPGPIRFPNWPVMQGRGVMNTIAGVG